eukprot:2006184-Pleurochrysis_carterae.AAC.1
MAASFSPIGSVSAPYTPTIVRRAWSKLTCRHPQREAAGRESFNFATDVSAAGEREREGEIDR